MWWALSVKVAWPPRVLKQRFTAAEAIALREYIRTQPIDDQSNHHVPMAQLAMIVSNMMGGHTKLKDFLLFRERMSDVDAELLSGGW